MTASMVRVTTCSQRDTRVWTGNQPYLTEEAIIAMKRAAKHDARLDGFAAKVEEVEAEVEGVRSSVVDAGAVGLCRLNQVDP